MSVAATVFADFIVDCTFVISAYWFYLHVFDGPKMLRCVPSKESFQHVTSAAMFSAVCCKTLKTSPVLFISNIARFFVVPMRRAR